MSMVFEMGQTITLINKKQIGIDEFNQPVYADEEIQVDNVLYTTNLTDDIISTTNLVGKKDVHLIAIPKGDTHIWENQIVIIEGKKYHIFTPCKKGIEALVPSPWNAQYLCESYE